MYLNGQCYFCSIMKTLYLETFTMEQNWPESFKNITINRMKIHC